MIMLGQSREPAMQNLRVNGNARMERSAIRGCFAVWLIPDYASLHPGYNAEK
jgi:hypothetical protein